MARKNMKKLLSESEIRQFMKLANIKPLKEMNYGREEEEPGMRDSLYEEEEEEMDMGAEEPAPEGGDDMEMDMEEPADDMDMEG